MIPSRYVLSSRAALDELHRVLLRFVDLPFRQHEAEWEAFMRDRVGLSMCYLKGVQKVIAEGRWKAKTDAVSFIRKSAQSAAFTSLGVKELPQDRTKVFVGRAIDPEQKKPRTIEELLQFKPPERRPKVFAGSISDLKLPMRVSAAGHDEAIDHLYFRYGDFSDKSPVYRDIARDVLKPCHGESDYDAQQDVDWERVAEKAKLDPGERQILKWRLEGTSRDSAIARQKNEQEKRRVQAAWRRFDRKSATIANVIRPTPNCKATRPVMNKEDRFIPAAEALARLSEKSLGATYDVRPKAPNWQPKYTDDSF